MTVARLKVYYHRPYFDQHCNNIYVYICVILWCMHPTHNTQVSYSIQPYSIHNNLRIKSMSNVTGTRREPWFNIVLWFARVSLFTNILLLLLLLFILQSSTVTYSLLYFLLFFRIPRAIFYYFSPFLYHQLLLLLNFN